MLISSSNVFPFFRLCVFCSLFLSSLVIFFKYSSSNYHTFLKISFLSSLFFLCHLLYLSLHFLPIFNFYYFILLFVFIICSFFLQILLVFSNFFSLLKFPFYLRTLGHFFSRYFVHFFSHMVLRFIRNIDLLNGYFPFFSQNRLLPLTHIFLRSYFTFLFLFSSLLH